MQKNLLLVVVFSCCCLEFYSADPNITTNEYAFKDSAITITCEYPQPNISVVSFVTQKKKTDLDPFFTTEDDEGDQKNGTSVRIDLTNVKCSDARNYSCMTFSSTDNRDMRSSWKILKVLEMPSKPLMSLIGNETCRGSKAECKECRRRSQKLPARKVDETFQIQCSNTMPKIGSQIFIWFYKDSKDEYQQITENVTNDTPPIISTSSPGDERKCVESQSVTSRLNFTPATFHHYEPTLILRCTTIYSGPGSVKKVEKLSDIEICLIDSRKTELSNLPKLKAKEKETPDQRKTQPPPKRGFKAPETNNSDSRKTELSEEPQLEVEEKKIPDSRKTELSEEPQLEAEDKKIPDGRKTELSEVPQLNAKEKKTPVETILAETAAGCIVLIVLIYTVHRVIKRYKSFGQLEGSKTSLASSVAFSSVKSDRGYDELQPTPERRVNLPPRGERVQSET